mmetsp:Transcript_29180/g.53284  ORF Transcript_29180/g.53284 Transcript_29180/m.53284 type:complete len:210 (-) Transcript_29180:1029-1658(-)
MLVLGELQQIGCDLYNDFLFVLLPAMLEHMLHDVVPIGVLRQRLCAVYDFLLNFAQLLRLTVLQQALNDATAIHVRRGLIHLLLDSFDDESHGIRGHLLDALLNDMVAVHVMNAIMNVQAELLGQHELRASRDQMQGLLYDAASIGVHCQGQYLALQLVGKLLTLIHGHLLKQFLDEVIAVCVLRQGCYGRQCLIQYHFLVGLRGRCII